MTARRQAPQLHRLACRRRGIGQPVQLDGPSASSPRNQDYRVRLFIAQHGDVCDGERRLAGHLRRLNRLRRSGRQQPAHGQHQRDRRERGDADRPAAPEGKVLEPRTWRWPRGLVGARFELAAGGKTQLFFDSLPDPDRRHARRCEFCHRCEAVFPVVHRAADYRITLGVTLQTTARATAQRADDVLRRQHVDCFRVSVQIHHRPPMQDLSF